MAKKSALEPLCEIKTCTTCLASLPVSEFYSKGSRHESFCKKCKKQKVKATYLAKRKSLSFGDIRRFIELIATLQLERMHAFENELSQIIKERRNRNECSTNGYIKEVA